MPTLATDDAAAIHYLRNDTADDVADDAPSIIFVHGWCGNATHWDRQRSHLGLRARSLAIDRRGHGLSTADNQHCTAHLHATDTALVANAEGVTDATVVGHAGGGATALTLAARWPQLVARVILIETRISQQADLAHTSSGLGSLLHRLASSDGLSTMTNLYRSFFVRPDQPPAQDIIGAALATPLPTAIADLAATGIDTVALARQLTQPVLWISSDPADTGQLESIFTHVSFAVVPGGGHFPHIESSATVNRLIDRAVFPHAGQATRNPPTN